MFRLSRSTRLVAALFAVLLLMNLGLTSALAAGRSWASEQNDTALEKTFVARESDMREVAKRIALAQEYNTQVKGVIAELQGKVSDTECLCGRQAVFEHHLQYIEGQLTTANELLATHPGFDAKGRVVDRTTARRTISELNDARKEIWAYGGDLYANMHRGFVAFKNAYPDIPVVEPVRPTERSLIS